MVGQWRGGWTVGAMCISYNRTCTIFDRMAFWHSLNYFTSQIVFIFNLMWWILWPDGRTVGRRQSDGQEGDRTALWRSGQASGWLCGRAIGRTGMRTSAWWSWRERGRPNGVAGWRTAVCSSRLAGDQTGRSLSGWTWTWDKQASEIYQITFRSD